MNITKLILNGLEYLITDKQAKQILEILNSKVDELNKRVEDLENPANYWKVIR